MCGEVIKGSSLAVILSIWLFLLASAAEAQSPPALKVLVDQVARVFPNAEGEVIEAEGATLRLSLGRRDGIQPGIELSLYREGRELRHPKTGELLGRMEQELGRVVVEQVFESYSTGAVIQAGDIRPGDKARVSAGKIKLTVLRLLSGVTERAAEAAIQELVEGLTRTGRFQVGMGDAISVWLAQEGITGEEFLQGQELAAAGERFKVQYLLAVSFKRVQEKPSMEIKLFSFPGATSLLSTALFVPPPIEPAATGESSAVHPQPVQALFPERARRP